MPRHHPAATAAIARRHSRRICGALERSGVVHDTVAYGTERHDVKSCLGHHGGEGCRK
jgi:hypothetical protein